MPKIGAPSDSGSDVSPTEMPLPRVLIAEEHAPVREGLCRLLSADFDVVDGVTDGRAWLAVAERLQLDVILLDVRIPEMNGMGAIRRAALTSAVLEAR